MGQPKAYAPEYGYKYQILARQGNEAYEHIDYAEDRKDLMHLLGEYRLAYGGGWSFKSILLPAKYHKKPEPKTGTEQRRNLLEGAPTTTNHTPQNDSCLSLMDLAVNLNNKALFEEWAKQRGEQ